ncbi:MAG TPA: signal peptidase I [Burkholderiales bacterium]|nr:signal peptidase I [Burkholderiales bacterium]
MNFALIMLVLLVVTGGVWMLDRFVLQARREVRIRKALADAGTSLALKPGESQTDYQARRETLLEDVHQKVGREPWWVEYSKSFFPVILLVFLLRSFLVEPFKIPSGSMIPTLLVGDFILVNKFTYGIRLPVVNVKVLDVNEPKRGEVMVFRYPEDPSLDYIKRLVGLPGDTVTYRDKRLWINGAEVPLEPDSEYRYVEGGLNYVTAKRMIERLGEHTHSVLINPLAPPVQLGSVHRFPGRDACEYSDWGFECKVPPGHYFMMGDNRDSSSDSRYWGFVPDRNIVGKAFMIWWNFSDFGRIGTRIN